MPPFAILAVAGLAIGLYYGAIKPVAHATQKAVHQTGCFVTTLHKCKPDKPAHK